MVNSVLVFTLITAGKYTKQVSQQFISHDMNVKSYAKDDAKDDAKDVHKKKTDVANIQENKLQCSL